MEIPSSKFFIESPVWNYNIWKFQYVTYSPVLISFLLCAPIKGKTHGWGPMILTSIGSFEFEPFEDSLIDSTSIDKIKSRPQISRTDL